MDRENKVFIDEILLAYIKRYKWRLTALILLLFVMLFLPSLSKKDQPKYKSSVIIQLGRIQHQSILPVRTLEKLLHQNEIIGMLGKEIEKGFEIREIDKDIAQLIVYGETPQKSEETLKSLSLFIINKSTASFEEISVLQGELKKTREKLDKLYPNPASTSSPASSAIIASLIEVDAQYTTTIAHLSAGSRQSQVVSPITTVENDQNSPLRRQVLLALLGSFAILLSFLFIDLFLLRKEKLFRILAEKI